jgi:uncharacterized protein YndB with AHSA1/START domain
VSRNERIIHFPPSAVYEVLADPSAFASWVVGTKEIRRADPSWPAGGSHFDHEVGAGAATLHDNTKSLAAEPNRRLLLSVRYRPFGVAEVEIELEPVGEGATRVVLRETATAGPTARLPKPISDAAFAIRNAVSLRRLDGLVRKRQLDRTSA